MPQVSPCPPRLLETRLLLKLARCYPAPTMREKRIVDLDQLGDSQLFDELSAGMRLVVENSTTLNADSDALWQQGNQRGARILRAIAEEEAAKYLILLDAARTPRGAERRLASHLRGFNDHMVKGIYARACYWQPVTYGYFCEYVEREAGALSSTPKAAP